jgi:hypothetical protein
MSNAEIFGPDAAKVLMGTVKVPLYPVKVRLDTAEMIAQDTAETIALDTVKEMLDTAETVKCEAAWGFLQLD